MHGLAHPLGLLYNIPHGLACALLLPYVVDFNIPACGDRYAMCAHMLGAGEAAEDLATWLRELPGQLGVETNLREQGLNAADFDKIVPPALASGSTKHNPREVAEEDLYALLHEMIKPQEGD